jgi:hypothetical protein
VKSKIIHSLYLGDNNNNNTIRKSQSKASIKKSTSIIISKTPHKEALNKTEKDKTAEDILIEMHLGEQKSESSRGSPKNRHSMSQVKMLQ